MKMILRCHLHLPFLYGYLISFLIFSEKRLNIVSTRKWNTDVLSRGKESASTKISFFYLLRFRNKEFVMVAGSSS